MSSWKLTEEASIYFTTSTIVGWYPVFISHQYFEIIIDSLKYCIENKRLQLHAYVIMLNHIHLIVSVKNTNPKRLSGIMRDFKRFTSQEITKNLKKDGNTEALNIFAEAAEREEKGNNFKVWRDGFHPKAIMTEQFGRQKLDYIHQNPVTKGYVLKPNHWRYSSAGYYAGSINYPLAVDKLV